MEKKVYLRLFGELNDFFDEPNKKTREIYYKDRQTIKDILEGIGIPHTEVYLIKKGNEVIDFSDLVKNNDHIKVYPVFRTLNIEKDYQTVRNKYPYDPRFIADAHLGKLVSYLRILGFDTLYFNDFGDKFLLEKIAKEKIIDRLEPKTKKYFNKFYICPNCEQIYWKGSHFKKINNLIENIEDEINNGI